MAGETFENLRHINFTSRLLDQTLCDQTDGPKKREPRKIYGKIVGVIWNHREILSTYDIILRRGIYEGWVILRRGFTAESTNVTNVTNITNDLKYVTRLSL